MSQEELKHPHSVDFTSLSQIQQLAKLAADVGTVVRVATQISLDPAPTTEVYIRVQPTNGAPAFTSTILLSFEEILATRSSAAELIATRFADQLQMYLDRVPLIQSMHDDQMDMAAYNVADAAFTQQIYDSWRKLPWYRRYLPEVIGFAILLVLTGIWFYAGRL